MTTESGDGSSLARRKTLELHSSDLLHLLDGDSGDFADVALELEAIGQNLHPQFAALVGSDDHATWR